MVLGPGSVGFNGDVLTPRGRTVAAVSPRQLRPGAAPTPSLPDHLCLSPRTRLTPHGPAVHLFPKRSVRPPRTAPALMPSPRPVDAVVDAALLPDSPPPPREARPPPPSSDDEQPPVSQRLAMRADEHALLAAAVARRDGHRASQKRPPATAPSSSTRRSERQRQQLAGHDARAAGRATARVQRGLVAARMREEAAVLAAAAPPSPPPEPTRFAAPFAPVERPPPSRHGGGGGVVHLTDEQMMDKAEREFGVWFRRFVREEQLEALALPDAGLLPEEERRALEKREILDDVALNTRAMTGLVREMRGVADDERAAEQRVEARLAEVARCNASVLSLEQRGGASVSAEKSRFDTGLQSVARHAEALMAEHARGLAAHYQLAWKQGRAELHGDALKELQTKMRAEHGEEVAVQSVQGLMASRQRRASRNPPSFSSSLSGGMGMGVGKGGLGALHEGRGDSRGGGGGGGRGGGGGAMGPSGRARAQLLACSDEAMPGGGGRGPFGLGMGAAAGGIGGIGGMGMGAGPGGGMDVRLPGSREEASPFGSREPGRGRGAGCGGCGGLSLGIGQGLGGACGGGACGDVGGEASCGGEAGMRPQLRPPPTESPPRTAPPRASRPLAAPVTMAVAGNAAGAPSPPKPPPSRSSGDGGSKPASRGRSPRNLASPGFGASRSLLLSPRVGDGPSALEAVAGLRGHTVGAPRAGRPAH